MGIFKKKENVGLPDLPASREDVRRFDSGVLPEFDEDDAEENHVLPAFPDSPTHNKFSQAVIKDAVGGSDENVSYDGKNAKIVEMEEWTPSMNVVEDYNPGAEKNISVGSFPGRGSVRERKGADIFVRLDKFRTAKKELDEISEKLEEIKEMIKRIRETKLREDQELSMWERDIMNVGARIQGVNENIFEKVE